MGKKLLLVTSFGTTYEDTCEKNIAAVEEHLARSFSDFEVRRAFTSGIVIRTLAERGVFVDDVPAALKRAANDGFAEVVIAPTHLLYGKEYEKIHRQTAESQPAFESAILIAKPLIANTDDMQTLIRMLSDAFPVTDKVAVAMMGHGSKHHVNPIYAALQTAFRLIGRDDIFVGTAETWPGIAEIVMQLKERSYEKVMLTPLMLVAGDHATIDEASDEDESWKTILQNEGYEVEVVMRGLGEYLPTRELYAAHVKEVLSR